MCRGVSREARVADRDGVATGERCAPVTLLGMSIITQSRLTNSPILILLVASMLMEGCGLFKNTLEEHRKVCERNAKLVILEPALWKKYTEGAKLVFEARRSQFGLETEQAIIEAVPGFEERYGSALSEKRQFVDDKVIRDDVFITFNGNVVAQYVDFTASLRSIDGATGLTCLSLYPELYEGKAINAK